MTKGRNKLPDRIKEMKGTDQPSRMSGDKQIFEPATKLPACPQWLNKPAKKMYRTLGNCLIRATILNESNVTAFGMMCQEVGTYIELNLDVKKEGYTLTWYDANNGRDVVSANPKIKLASDAYKNAKSMMVEFGLTPAALAKIIAIVSIERTPDDPLQEFLNG